ncbi:uncharacterized protein LOC112572216 [Pomacea canaliculata]|uniref:uncharacterized protein LOC112572216 n=1 Tax=Pomacea canaliculata TaxID=400727 RepID=UPI000D730826|nr:uncharacterized protein LOC112572216 [Pomacea canaliculata]
MESSFFIAGTFLVFISLVQGQSICTSLFGVLPHPTDCSGYIECVGGQPVQRRCPTDRVFSSLLDDCVFPWDTNADLCPRKQDSVVTICTNYSTAFFPHPTNCHQFYNCTGHSTLIYFPPVSGPDSDDFYRFECPFPQLFNDVTMRCEDYPNVRCGHRFQPLGQCEYDRLRCQTGRCLCENRWPSCRGLPDGENVFKYREWSPYFIICKDQRLADIGRCSTHPRLNVQEVHHRKYTKYFSPDLNRCASLYEIPREHNGFFLNCTGRPDGLYPDDGTNRTNLYFRCTSGVQTEISLCPDGQYFNAQSSYCIAGV